MENCCIWLVIYLICRLVIFVHASSSSSPLGSSVNSLIKLTCAHFVYPITNFSRTVIYPSSSSSPHYSTVFTCHNERLAIATPLIVSNQLKCVQRVTKSPEQTLNSSFADTGRHFRHMVKLPPLTLRSPN